MNVPFFSTTRIIDVCFCEMRMLTLGSAGQNLYFHLNHPIKWIRLVGLIVTFDIHPNRFVMILDDSSGSTIEITCGRKTPPPKSNATDMQTQEDHTTRSIRAPVTQSEADTKGLTATGYDVNLHGIDIGSVVKVKGGIGDFRGQRQILLERISVVRTTTEEVAAWAENTAFRRDVLDRPWFLSEDEHTIAKRKAEGLDRERELRKKKKNRRTTEKGRKKPGGVTLVKGPQLEKDHRKREEDERRWREERENKRTEEQDRKYREEEAMKTIEQEDADRKRREEATRKMREEQESRRREEEEKKRKDEVELERLATQRRRRNEARETILREMGAGR